MTSGTGSPHEVPARDRVELRTAQLEQEPAVRAWQRLAAGPCPTRLEVLRRRAKSVVYRLPQVGRGGSDVIAKQCPWQIALDERAVYEALCELPDSGLTYYGFTPEPAYEFGWIFAEDARGDLWDPGDAAQRRTAARWLARLHTASARTSHRIRLPDRDTGWFHGLLHRAGTRIVSGFGNPAIGPAGQHLLADVLRLLDTLAVGWPKIESACASMPRCLVHGDFAERNVRIRFEAGEARVLAFDWEMAGWGLPAVDLLDADLSVYAEGVQASWPSLDLAALTRFAQLGSLLRGGIAATSWAAESLATSWPHRAITDIEHYQRRMRLALDALGLQAKRGIP